MEGWLAAEIMHLESVLEVLDADAAWLHQQLASDTAISDLEALLEIDTTSQAAGRRRSCQNQPMAMTSILSSCRPGKVLDGIPSGSVLTPLPAPEPIGRCGRCGCFTPAHTGEWCPTCCGGGR